MRWRMRGKCVRASESDVLTAKRLREVVSYDPETGHFTWLVSRPRARIGGRAGGLGPGCGGYWCITIDRRRYVAHRLAWLYMTGAWPRTEMIDHINRDRSDNRFANLREATRGQNQVNSGKPSNNSSGFKGVRRRYGRWFAQIKKSGKHYHLGYFSTPEEAHRAYCTAAIKLHGEFARLT